MPRGDRAGVGVVGPTVLSGPVGPQVGRRTLLAGGLAGGVAASLAAGAWVPAAAAADPVVSTFVSMPDFFNGDVGDLRALPRWDGGENSVNDSWRAAIATCLDEVAAHRPDAVLVAGDLVEGRWNVDTGGRELFGPVGPGTDEQTLRRCRAAITAAGSVYYPFHRDLFAARGLRLLPALGDHEILDDRAGPLDRRWSPGGRQRGVPDNRWWLVPHAKRTWASHFTRSAGGAPRFSRRPVGAASEWTAYATTVGDRLTVVSVDMFHHHRGGVALGVDGAQLVWLRREVRHAKRRGHVVVVQGHLPVLRPYRQAHSGGLRVPAGARSPFWQVMCEEGVDAFLCGEVHDTTAVQGRRGAPLQLSHGGVFRYGFSYVVGRVRSSGSLELESFEVPLLRASRERGLWCTDAGKRQRTLLEYASTSVGTGRLVLRDHRVRSRSGELAPYDPREPDRWSHRNRDRVELV